MVFKVLGKNCQLISQKLHFPRPNSSCCFLNHCVKSQKTHLLSVLTDRVCWPSAIVRVTPLYWMCGRVAYLCVAFPHHIAKVCEKFVNFKRIFCRSPAMNITNSCFCVVVLSRGLCRRTTGQCRTQPSRLCADSFPSPEPRSTGTRYLATR